jgi:uncharacterized protein
VAIRLVLLVGGIASLALGIVVIVRAGLGSDPLTACIQGLAASLGLSLGRATQLLFVLFLLLVGLVDRTGLGVATLLSVLLEGPLIDIFDGMILWKPAGLGPRFVGLGAGILLSAVGIAVYVTPQLGAGPPEAVMLAIHRRGRLRLAYAKLLLDTLCVFVGWRLGGNIGLGTVLAAVLVGPVVDALVHWIERFRL